MSSNKISLANNMVRRMEYIDRSKEANQINSGSNGDNRLHKKTNKNSIKRT